MQVVHVASGREWRGGQRQVWLLARALARQRTLSQVVVTGRDSELARRLAAADVPVVTPRWSGAFDLRALAATFGASGRETILHAHDSHALALAGLVTTFRRAPLVATRRVDVPLRRAGFWRRANRVIAVSEAVRRALQTSGIPGERVAVVHSGINVAEIRETVPLDPRPQLALAPGTPLAVTTGALVGVKDHATLVRAARIVADQRSDLHWVIAGEGHRRDALEALIAELALVDRVHLLGEVPDAVRLVAAAELFVMPSAREGLGTSILDAMALGIPVVGTRAGGIPELLEDGGGLLVPPGDPPALAQAVLELLNDPGRRLAQAARARQAVGQFSDERMAAGVFRVYRSINSTY